jgi:hypothetical protein
MSTETAVPEKPKTPRKRAKKPADLLDQHKAEMKKKIGQLNREVGVAMKDVENAKKAYDTLRDVLAAKAAERDRVVAGLAAIVASETSK